MSISLKTAFRAPARAAGSITVFAVLAAALCGVAPVSAAPVHSAPRHPARARLAHPALLKSVQRPAAVRSGVHSATFHVGRPASAHALAHTPLTRTSTRPVYRLMAHGRHRVVMRSVAFAPARPVMVQPFRLRDQVGEALALRSSVAYVVDQKTSEPLFEKNSQAIVPIASISKLMTAMVTLDSHLPLTDTLSVTDEDRDYEKGTGSRLSVGSVLSREDMLHIALMSSENRAAAALSRYFPGGRPAFVAAMNRKAHELGMADTHFLDPTGLTSQNVSSARDLVKMVDAAYQYPLIRRFSTDSAYDVYTGKRIIHYGSTNALVRNPAWDIGLQKTGFINEAGECLVMQTVIDSRPVVMVLLDSFGKYSRTGDAQRVRSWLHDGGTQRITSADTGRAGT